MLSWLTLKGLSAISPHCPVWFDGHYCHQLASASDMLTGCYSVKIAREFSLFPEVRNRNSNLSGELIYLPSQTQEVFP